LESGEYNCKPAIFRALLLAFSIANGTALRIRVLQCRPRLILMPDAPLISDALLEIRGPDSSVRSVRVAESPFLIGRGAGTGNHLQLSDSRISRRCAAIACNGGQYHIEDSGQRGGIFINGKKIDKHTLADGDVITFGSESPHEITFRSSAADASVKQLLTRIGTMSCDDPSSGGLNKINLLLEATMLLHSQLPLDAVLGTVLDHAIAITGADRGLLLEADPSGSIRTRLARRGGGLRISADHLAPSQTAVRLALEQQSSVITENLNEADVNLQGAKSIVAQSLRAVVAIPLYSMPRAGSAESILHAKRGQLLGVLYLDSRRPAAFSKLDRQILDALAVDAASILDNARLVEHERRRQRLEQELSIARDIQQALLPGGFRDFPHLVVTGIHSPCLAVGGDYFDVFPLSDHRTAFLIADVSGKGLGAALLTTMLQGALSGMVLGTDPAKVFNHINCFLCEHSEVGRYATMFFGILEPSGHLEFINAGHPSPLLLRGGEVAEPFTEGSFPVGLIPGAEYVSASMDLQAGDTLILFSDGVTEAMNPDEQMFGVSGLREALAGQHQSPLDHLQRVILRSVGEFAHGTSQADDITLLLVRYRAAMQSASP
jgi:sigma-B regulation protein RsbU (phosphoserine phosphatase)